MLSFGQKVYRIEHLARMCLPHNAARSRLLDVCDGLRWTDQTRAVILDRYLADPDEVWLHELGDLGDALCYACMVLAETIKCEVRDTEQTKSDRSR